MHAFQIDFQPEIDTIKCWPSIKANTRPWVRSHKSNFNLISGIIVCGTVPRPGPLLMGVSQHLGQSSVLRDNLPDNCHLRPGAGRDQTRPTHLGILVRWGEVVVVVMVVVFQQQQLYPNPSWIAFQIWWIKQFIPQNRNQINWSHYDNSVFNQRNGWRNGMNDGMVLAGGEGGAGAMLVVMVWFPFSKKSAISPVNKVRQCLHNSESNERGQGALMF